MNNFGANYKRILGVLQKIAKNQLLTHQRRKPKLSDLELIAVNITAEYMSIDSESDLFRKLPKFLTDKIERSVYNRRKRKLFAHMEQIRQKLASFFNELEEYFIVDSMPLEICRKARESRSTFCNEVDYAKPNYGYCASQKLYFYGYKLHAVCSFQGVFQNVDLTPASVHDIHYMKDIQKQISNTTLIADKGYLSENLQLDLFENYNRHLSSPMRKNQKDDKEQAYIFRMSRPKIS